MRASSSRRDKQLWLLDASFEVLTTDFYKVKLSSLPAVHEHSNHKLLLPGAGRFLLVVGKRQNGQQCW
jgi:hypothetical protein